MLHEELTEIGAWDREFDDLEMRLVLVSLKPQDALALQLTYWDGLSASEAAKVMECSTPAFWARLSRARQSLRTALGDEQSLASRTYSPERGDLAHE